MSNTISFSFLESDNLLGTGVEQADVQADLVDISRRGRSRWIGNTVQSWGGINLRVNDVAGWGGVNIACIGWGDGCGGCRRDRNYGGRLAEVGGG